VRRPASGGRRGLAAAAARGVAAPRKQGRRPPLPPMPPKHQLPALYPFRFFVTEGGLIAYGYDINEITGVQPVTSLIAGKWDLPG
jgi:hypothetical protein